MLQPQEINSRDFKYSNREITENLECNAEESQTYVHAGFWDSFIIDSDPSPADELVIYPKMSPSTPEMLITNREMSKVDTNNSPELRNEFIAPVNYEINENFINNSVKNENIDQKNTVANFFSIKLEEKQLISLDEITETSVHESFEDPTPDFDIPSGFDTPQNSKELSIVKFVKESNFERFRSTPRRVAKPENIVWDTESDKLYKLMEEYDYETPRLIEKVENKEK